MSEQDPRPCYVPEDKACAVGECHDLAVSFRDKCWKHLSDEECIAFREEMATRVQSESWRGACLEFVGMQGAFLVWANLEKANLQQADLQNVLLARANLQEAVLRKANLQDADLGGANLQGAVLRDANLQEANLSEANLQEASLGFTYLQKAHLIEANLQKADLGRANLQKAILKRANLQEANLRAAYLQGAFLAGVLWRGARYLTATQVGETGEYVLKDWAEAEDAYRRLKNHFHEEGRYDDESWAFVMEKTCARKLAFEKKRLIRWLALSLWNLLAGYGEKWWRALCWATGIIVFFAVLYYPNPWGWGRIALEGRCPLASNDPVRALYFSIVTFATLGFGDLSPVNRPAAIAVMVEVLLGYVMLGTLVALIARKMTR